MDAATFLARRNFLGASEVAAVCGLDPMKSAADVWATKRGYLGQDESEAAEMGNLLEPVLITKYAAGRKVEKPGTIIKGYRAATPDAIVESVNAQVKVVGARMLHHWYDGVPDYVQAQVQAEMYVADLKISDVVALLGGTDYQVFRIERDDEAIEAINEVCARFWTEYVIGDKQPAIHLSRKARGIVAARYPIGAGMGRAVPEFVKVAEKYAQLGRVAKQATEQREELAISMKLAIGEREGLEWSGGKVTWKGKKTRAFRVKVNGIEGEDDE
jgi:predicted phage-related endonuclease